MSGDVVIRAEGLGKKYIIAHQEQRERYVALRDVIARKTAHVVQSSLRIGRNAKPSITTKTEEFWALRDVSFEVKRGEVIGVLGRNGAGKSTLLKVLSRITEPSEGRVVIEGRVASLLEVGTGFHPELSGRENIFLNGAILGMTRAEIRRKFDQIVAFAEIELFLDTPVKRYSSGMYVRLAFAVAAHLEPEIIIIDEVLAVGDFEFQRKCLGKMSEIANDGRTVLFVSHNMGAIQALCPRSIYLASGLVAGNGPTGEMISHYLDGHKNAAAETRVAAKTSQSGLILQSLRFSPQVIRSNESVDLELILYADNPGQIRECALLIYSAIGTRVAIIDTRESGAIPCRYDAGNLVIKAQINKLPLIEGIYSVGVFLVTDKFMGDILDISHFTVGESKVSKYVPYSASSRGVISLDASVSITMPQRSISNALA
jgi:lipopolysaccharide transport system ATP-binding protein